MQSTVIQIHIWMDSKRIDSLKMVIACECHMDIWLGDISKTWPTSSPAPKTWNVALFCANSLCVPSNNSSRSFWTGFQATSGSCWLHLPESKSSSQCSNEDVAHVAKRVEFGTEFGTFGSLQQNEARKHSAKAKMTTCEWHCAKFYWHRWMYTRFMQQPAAAPPQNLLEHHQQHHHHHHFPLHKYYVFILFPNCLLHQPITKELIHSCAVHSN